MPRLSICSATWILTLLLLDLAAMENKSCPTYSRKLEERVINMMSGAQESAIRKKWTHDLLPSFWKRRLLYQSVLTELNPSETSRFGDKQEIEDTNAAKGYRYMMKNVEKTLTDYDGPVIMGNSDDKHDWNLASHVRVKRSEPASNSMIRQNHSAPNSVNSSSRSWDESNVTSSADRRDENQNNRVFVETHSRRKRQTLLSKNEKHRRRAKGNAGHSKHHVRAKTKDKKHGVSKSPSKSIMRKASILRKKSKKVRPKTLARAISKSPVEARIEKRESSGSDLNDIKRDVPLISNRSSNEQLGDNAVMLLPFVHTGRAELRVRIEKLPANETVRSDDWTDSSSVTSQSVAALTRYEIIENINADNTSSKSIPNFDSVRTERTNDSTVEIMLKLNYDVLDRKACDLRRTSLSNSEFRPIATTLLAIEDDRNSVNGVSDRDSETLAIDEDARSRAKRNQEVYMKRDQILRHGRSRVNRATRSIWEIKELAKKLVAKVNELQVYMSNYSETPNTTNPCVDKKDANRVNIQETVGFSAEGLSSKSKIASNIDDQQHSVKKIRQTIPMRKGASNVSRFARGGYRNRRKSHRKWGRWMDWSSCSVTCGKGRQIRWRHCLRDCDDAETEMEEKACQLPACPPGKFLGIF